METNQDKNRGNYLYKLGDQPSQFLAISLIGHWSQATHLTARFFFFFTHKMETVSPIEPISYIFLKVSHELVNIQGI